MAELKYEIVEHIGVLSENARGWRKELNLVSWNGGAPKYDLRDWDPDHERMSRGITLHEKEMRLIIDMVRRHRQSRRGSKVLEKTEDDIPVTEDEGIDP